MCRLRTGSFSTNWYMSSNIASLEFRVSQNCTYRDFLSEGDTIASPSKCTLMRLERGLKRTLVSDFLSPMKSRIGFADADIEAIEGGLGCPSSTAISASTTPARRLLTPVARDSGFPFLLLGRHAVRPHVKQFLHHVPYIVQSERVTTNPSSPSRSTFTIPIGCDMTSSVATSRTDDCAVLLTRLILAAWRGGFGSRLRAASSCNALDELH
jgi:hypothetical protein